MQSESNGSETGANGQVPALRATGDAALQDVKSEFHSFLADIEDLIISTTSLTGDDLARAKAKLSERIATARTSMERMGGAISDRARSSAVATNKYVHEQPWKAVGIGAAIGVLLGFMLSRRS